MSLRTLLQVCATLTLLAPLLPQVFTAAVDGGQNHASVTKGENTNACEAAGGTCTKDPQCKSAGAELTCPKDAPYCCMSQPSAVHEGSNGQEILMSPDVEDKTVNEEKDERDHRQLQRKQNGDRWSANTCSNKRKCVDAGGVCMPQRQCKTVVQAGKCGRSCECCLKSRAVATTAATPNSLPSDVQQLLVALTATLLDLLSLQNTIISTQLTILNAIASVVAPGVDFGSGRMVVSPDVQNLHATAEKMTKTVMSRTTANIRVLITELETRRLSLMNLDPRGITRADVTNLSHTAKLLVAVMRVLPDMYDAALTKAVSAKMRQI